ncbi:gliding motility-associated C-terminal domain-containing protein [Crocinitomicaceae bacterium]|nr:gliding motility-associated C-terminal domain-containing protein [Crocinitomicaceae bacterium]
MKITRHIAFLALTTVNVALAQPSNDVCPNAVQLCPGVTVSGTTTGATSAADDYGFCYTPENTVWFRFITNSSGGSVSVDFSNLSFNPDPDYGQELRALFFETSGDCGVAPYTPMSNCGDNNTDFSLTESILLAPNTTYYVQVSGTSDGAINPSECDFDIDISGSAVETPEPSVSISAIDTDICQNESVPVEITITDCDDTTQYEWFYNGSLISSGDENTFSTALLSENGTLSLDITCGLGCPKTTSSNTIDFTVTPVSAEAGDDQVITEGESAFLSGSGVGSPTWSPAINISDINSLNPIASPEATTTYYLTMENDGCLATDSVTVFVGDVITIYSSFTPNGDNINDRWHILNSEKFPNMEVNIYSRSGQLVFSAVNYSTEDQWWDGQFKGKDLPTSTYYYVVRLNDGSDKEYKGIVTIVR